MSKENSENTPDFKSYRGDGKQGSSDSDDLEERPGEMFRKVLSENFISPIKTPTKDPSPVSRKSSSPMTDGNKVNDCLPFSLASTSNQRQSTSPLNCMNTGSNSDLGGNMIAEEIKSTCPTDKFISYGSVTVEYIPLEAYHSEDLLSNDSTRSVESNPNEYSNLVDPFQSTSSGHSQESPLVFVANMHIENEISLNPVENESVDLAADVLIYDSSVQDSPKQIPTSAESEDSESESISFRSFPYENVSSVQEFTTPVELMFEIRSVFTLISEYVSSGIRRTRTKLETLEINGSRKRRFLGSRISTRDVPNNIQTLASRLFSKMTEQERQQDIYHGPSQSLVQTSVINNPQDSSRGSSHGGSCGITIGGSDVSERPTQVSSERSDQSSRRGGGGSQSPRGVTQSSRGATQVSSGDPGRSMREFAEGSNCPMPQAAPVFFAQGYSLGMQIGSVSYTDTVTGRSLQNRLSQMIQQLPQEFPQELFALTSETISLRFPRISNWINKLIPGELRQVYYAGIFQGFSRFYSAERQSSYTQPPSGFVQDGNQGLSRGFSQGRSRGFPNRGIPQQNSRGFSQGLFRGFPRGLFRGHPQGPPGGFSHGPVRGFLRDSLHRYLSFRRPHRTSRESHRGTDSGPPPRPSQNFSQRPNQEPELEWSAQDIEERIQQLLQQSLQDLNMIKALADLFLKEYSKTAEKNYENISNYLLCFEIMREDFRERENWFVLLERAISSNLGNRRGEAFAFLHLQTLNEIFETCISRVQYGALLLKVHENISEFRSISRSIRELARKAMSYEFWTKEQIERKLN